MTNTATNETPAARAERFRKGAEAIVLATIDYRISSLPAWKHAIAVDTVTQLDAFITGWRLLSGTPDIDDGGYGAEAAWHYILEGGF